MAENESGQEKTEEPTSKRLREAREKGQTARSRDFNNLVILITSASAFLLLGPTLAEDMLTIMKEAFSFRIDVLKTPAVTMAYIYHLVLSAIYVIAPFLIVITIAALLGPILIGGWSFSQKALAPKFERLSPIKGIKKMFSLKSLVELVKAILKFVVVGGVALSVLLYDLPSLLTLSSFPVTVAISKVITILAWSFLMVSSGLIIIAIVDVPYQLWEHSRQLKMTLQEVKDEHKETEGKPEVKSAIRRAQQEMTQRRMMQKVPEADVVLTNPTHYSVALKYDMENAKAPVVLAKGQDFVAQQINKVANGNDVPILQLPPLARAIYYSTEVDKEIPHGLFVAVAQVLAYIFQLRRKGRLDEIERSPRVLENLPIPDDLQVAAKGET